MRLALAALLLAACTFKTATLPLEADAGLAIDAPIPSADAPISSADAPIGTIDAARMIDAARPDAARPDAARPDAARPDAAPPQNPLGGPCPSAACPTGTYNFCFNTANNWSSTGFCTKTCAKDPECGAGAHCVNAIGVCVPDCGTNGSCPYSNLVCTRWYVGYVDMGTPGCIEGNPAAQDGDACNGFYDCNSDSTCASDPYEEPGGYCVKVHCTIGDDTTCNGGHCYDNGKGVGFCLESCTQVSDCTRTDYTCELGAAPPYCFSSHASPGASCASDSVCGFAPWQCLQGATFPGGYCSGTNCTVGDANTCPFGSSCYAPVSGPTYCAAVCDPKVGCRSGYICTAYGSTFVCL